MANQPAELRNSGMASGLSWLDRLRIGWAGVRYNFWLDLRFVRSKVRRELRRELVANLREAAADVGVSRALANVGSLRTLATEVARPDESQPRWYAGPIAGLAAAAGSFALFLAQAATYAEGVLDADVDREVSSGLFPFPWSQVTVSPGDDGMSVAAQSGPLPMILALAIGLVVARPWRVLTGRRSAGLGERNGTPANLD